MSQYTIPTVVETRLHDYLLPYLRHDHAPDFYAHNMRATIQYPLQTADIGRKATLPLSRAGQGHVYGYPFKAGHFVT